MSGRFFNNGSVSGADGGLAKYMELNKAPHADNLDKAHVAVSAALSAIPIVGGPATELFKAIIMPPLEKRRDKWMELIGTAIQELQLKSEDWSAEALTKNDKFVTAMIHATSVAIRNHQDEKLEALRNAVLNLAAATGIDENMQMMFISFIDVLTPLHLKLLALLNDPVQYAQKVGIEYPNWGSGGKSTVVEYAIPELKGRGDIYGPITRDMYGRGLLATQELNTTMTGSGMMQSITSPLGKQFLKFISRPQALAG